MDWCRAGVDAKTQIERQLVVVYARNGRLGERGGQRQIGKLE